ncbi:hypothetical protein [Edaphovirga cremea]|uniref:hypothetical protein n=1 Tax=Edaphovirga cremea TaxID=2267246 RepID=UPI003988DC5A
MNVKETVKIATNYIAELFANEQPFNIGLEEVTKDDINNQWEVTIGFSRPWDTPRPGFVTNLQPQQPNRQYKVVTISDTTGEVKSVKIREKLIE